MILTQIWKKRATLEGSAHNFSTVNVHLCVFWMAGSRSSFCWSKSGLLLSDECIGRGSRLLSQGLQFSSGV